MQHFTQMKIRYFCPKDTSYFLLYSIKNISNIFFPKYTVAPVRVVAALPPDCDSAALLSTLSSGPLKGLQELYKIEIIYDHL